MHFIDSHTHLYSDQFNNDREVVINEANAAGVKQFLLPNIDQESVNGMKELLKKYPKQCYAMMGLHPCSVKENVEEQLNQLKMEFPDFNSIIAIGEIGIDLYWDKTLLAQQEFAFREQIKWAKELALPIVIHCRESFDEILAILDEENDDRLSGVFHCFTGSIDQAKHILSYGNFKLGIGGVVTFKNSGLDKVVEQLELNDLVLETDSPYLAPSPYRGKRNESKYLINVAQKVAEIFQISLQKVAEQTTANCNTIFRL